MEAREACISNAHGLETLRNYSEELDLVNMEGATYRGKSEVPAKMSLASLCLGKFGTSVLSKCGSRCLAIVRKFRVHIQTRGLYPS